MKVTDSCSVYKNYLGTLKYHFLSDFFHLLRPVKAVLGSQGPVSIHATHNFPFPLLRSLSVFSFSLLWAEFKLCSFCDFSFLQSRPHTVPFTPTTEVLRVSFSFSIFIALFSKVTLLWVSNRNIVTMWWTVCLPQLALAATLIHQPALVLSPIASLWLTILPYFNYEII